MRASSSSPRCQSQSGKQHQRDASTLLSPPWLALTARGRGRLHGPVGRHETFGTLHPSGEATDSRRLTWSISKHQMHVPKTGVQRAFSGDLQLALERGGRFSVNELLLLAGPLLAVKNACRKGSPRGQGGCSAQQHSTPRAMQITSKAAWFVAVKVRCSGEWL